jgi:O-antigen/teichoic acid export membrane protein
MHSLGINAINIVSFAILARLISTKEMGIYTILLLINATCQTFATLSVDQAVTKFVAENFSRGAVSAAAGAFYQALRTTLTIAIPVVALIYYGAPSLAVYLLGDVSYAVLFQVLAVDVLFSAGALPVIMSGLLGLQMFREFAAIDLIFGSLLRQTMIILLIVLLRNFVGLVIAWVFSDAATVLVLLAYAISALGVPRFDFPLTKLLRFSFPLTLGSVAGYAQTWFDRALLVAFVPLATLGIYNAALTAFGVLTGVASAVASMLYTAYSSIKGEAQFKDRMRDGVRLATRYSSFTLIPLSFGLLAVAKPALTLLVGGAYASGSLPLIIFSGAFAVTAFTAALSPVLLALEETKIAAAITAVSVAMSLVVAYVLLPEWGMVGASVARAFAIILGAVLTILVVSRKMTLQVDILAVAKNLVASAIMAIVLVAFQLMIYSKFLLPVYVLIGAIVYLVLLRLLRAVEPADLSLLRGFLGPRLSLVSTVLSWIILPKDSRSDESRKYT